MHHKTVYLVPEQPISLLYLNLRLRLSLAFLLTDCQSEYTLLTRLA